MSWSFSWARRDETGKRRQIEFRLVRDKAEWKIHRERFEQREDYTPDDEDWETLIGHMQRSLQRGKVYATDLDIVRKLRQRSRE